MYMNHLYHQALFHAAVATTDKARNIREISRHIEHSHPGPVGGRILYTENHDTVPGDREKRYIHTCTYLHLREINSKI